MTLAETASYKMHRYPTMIFSEQGKPSSQHQNSCLPSDTLFGVHICISHLSYFHISKKWDGKLSIPCLAPSPELESCLLSQEMRDVMANR